MVNTVSNMWSTCLNPHFGPRTNVGASRVQNELRPLLLRRMKEDVETLPDKEEVIIWVELTNEQRYYYKALYENQIAALLGGGKGANLPQMRNLAMELRKLCCHPVRCFPLLRLCCGVRAVS